jgi:hypothetical protein
MSYALEAGGPDHYPVQVGTMLLTLVEPHKGYERAFNRWYERDHFYGGCMEGANTLAGGRFVATRALKDLRWPEAAGARNPVADPIDAGAYVALYWIQADRHADWMAWSSPQVRDLYANGRGFPERTHVHTVIYSLAGADYRDADPVPVALALDRRYAGLVILWFDGLDGRAPADSLAELRREILPGMLAGSKIEIAATLAPILPPRDAPPANAPMALGSGPGGETRFCQLMFLDDHPGDTLPRLHAYADAVRAAGIAELRLAAPFIKTVVGTDTYVDQLP